MLALLIGINSNFNKSLKSQFVAAIIDGLFAKTTAGWRYMLGLAMIPALCQFVIFKIALPESPRFLIEKGKKNEAKKILRKIRASENVTDELQEIEADINRQKEQSSLSLLIGLDKIFKRIFFFLTL